MDKEMVIKKLRTIMNDLLKIVITDNDINLFSTAFHISPVMMIYLLMELEHEFSIKINDQFMEHLPTITINHLADAICMVSE